MAPPLVQRLGSGSVPTTVPTIAAAAMLLVSCQGPGRAAAQPLRDLGTDPACIEQCLRTSKGCKQCVRELAQRLSTPAQLNLKFHKAHPGLVDPRVGVEAHHHFEDRPPWAPGSVPVSHRPGQVVDPEGKVHKNCPAMKARSGVSAITLHMPYTCRWYRSGKIEFDLHWIAGTPMHVQEIVHPVDSPWLRLPQSHLQMFTVGDSRADVWILNSGIYIDDVEFMTSPNAKPGDKGGSTGNKWMVMPLPHRLGHPGWRIEQGVLSSFQRTSKNANIPLQLNFTAIPPEQEYIEIARGTPMMQYVPAVLPSVTLREAPMPTPLADYLVMLSRMHKAGDLRINKENDLGGYDVMRSYQLKDNPGYAQSHRPRKRAAAPRRGDL